MTLAQWQIDQAAKCQCRGYDDMCPCQNHHFGSPGDLVGKTNLYAVRAWFAAHLCGTARECGAALGLSELAVGRHVKTIRREWGQGNGAAL